MGWEPLNPPATDAFENDDTDAAGLNADIDYDAGQYRRRFDEPDSVFDAGAGEETTAWSPL